MLGQGGVLLGQTMVRSPCCRRMVGPFPWAGLKLGPGVCLLQGPGQVLPYQTSLEAVCPGPDYPASCPLSPSVCLLPLLPHQGCHFHLTEVGTTGQEWPHPSCLYTNNTSVFLAISGNDILLILKATRPDSSWPFFQAPGPLVLCPSAAPLSPSVSLSLHLCQVRHI